MPTNCLLCNFSPIEVESDALRRKYYVRCKRCGSYSITEECFIFSDKKVELEKVAPALSGLLRELQSDGIVTKENRLEFMTTNIAEYARDYLVPDMDSVEEKAKKLIQYIRRKTEYFGSSVKLNITFDFPVAYAKNETEFRALLLFLNEKGYISNRIDSVQADETTRSRITLSAAGWELAHSLKTKHQKSKKVFIALKFEDTNDNNQKIECLENCVRDTGFEPMCIKHKDYNDTIMDKALGEIRESRFVVADITDDSSAVAHEAGFAHGLGLTVIYTHRVGEDGQLPAYFYAKQYKIYTYKNLDELKEKLTPAIKARIQT